MEQTVLSINDDKMTTRGELIEYPAELIGGRNLFSINTAEIRAWISSSHIIASADDSTLYAIPVEPNTYYTFNIDSPYTNLLRTGYITSSTVIGSPVIMSNRNTSVPRTIKTGANATFFIVQVATGTSEDAKRTIKLEKGNKSTPWTPAPEDLGLSYPDWVTEFKPSISEDWILAPEFDESGVLSFSINRTTSQEFIENPNL